MRKPLKIVIAVLLTSGFWGLSHTLMQAQNSVEPLRAVYEKIETVAPTASPLSVKTGSPAAAMASALQLKAVKPAKNPDKATLTLDVQIDWGDGSGYQLLLDAGGAAYDMFAYQTGITTDADQTVNYADYFTYTLPANATGNLTDGHWLTAADDPASMEIDPGIYAFFVANPTPGDMIYVASGFSKAKEYYFAAGVEYIFTVKPNGDNDRTFLNPVVRDVPAMNLPYNCNFNDIPAYLRQWVVYDADANRDSWRLFSGVKEDEDDYCVGLRTDLDVAPGIPEGIMTAFPVHLSAGDYHISWQAKTREYPETFYILVGTEGEVSKMDIMDERNSFYSPDGFVQDAVNFTVEPFEEGDYYFGFAACYTDAFYLFIDDVEIAEGKAVGRPDLRVDKILSPVSSCGLTAEEPLKVRLNNVGMADIHKIRVKGKLNGEDFTETLDLELPAGQSEDVVLAVFDLSLPGGYAINFDIEVLSEEGEEAETVTGNNSGETFVGNWDPEKPLPFTSDLSLNTAEVHSDWSYDEDWFYSDIFHAFAVDKGNNAMASRCVNLKAGTLYTVALNYRTGYLLAGVQANASNLTVAVGKTGSAMSTWKKIANPTANTKIFVDGVFDFTVSEDDTYSIYIYSTTNPVAISSGDAVIFLRSFELREVAEYDVRLDNVMLPALMPERQINGNYNLPVTVTNRALEEIGQVKAEVSVNGLQAGQTEFGIGEFNESVIAPVRVIVSGLKEGQTATVQTTVSIVEHEDDEATPSDNTLSRKVKVSGHVLAYDTCTEAQCTDPGESHIGHYEYKKLGLPIYVTRPDTLTAITALMSEATNTYTPQAGVYRFDPYTYKLGELVVFDSFRPTPAAGLSTYELPATVLESGWYFIFVGIHDYRMMVDHSSGVFYTVAPGDSTLFLQSGFGLPGIRAVFGSVGEIAPGPDTTALEKVFTASTLKLYPNPAKQTINIVSEREDILEVSIHNLSGREIYSAVVNAPEFRYNVATLPKGLYLARITTIRGVKTMKFIVE